MASVVFMWPLLIGQSYSSRVSYQGALQSFSAPRRPHWLLPALHRWSEAWQAGLSIEWLWRWRQRSGMDRIGDPYRHTPPQQQNHLQKRKDKVSLRNMLMDAWKSLQICIRTNPDQICQPSEESQHLWQRLSTELEPNRRVKMVWWKTARHLWYVEIWKSKMGIHKYYISIVNGHLPDGGAKTSLNILWRITPILKSIIRILVYHLRGNRVCHLCLWWNFRTTVDFPLTTCLQVTTSWGVTATPEPQTDPLSTRHTVGYLTTPDSWAVVARQRPDCTGLSQTSWSKSWRLTQRRMLLKIDWTEQTSVRPIHSFAFQQNGDTITPIRRTSPVLFATNTPPPSVPGKHLASVRMTALSSPARLLTIPLLRVLMNRSRQREPNGEPQAMTGWPFWREEQLCQGIASEPRPSTFSFVFRTANQLRNRASLISSLSSASAWKRHWSAPWKTAWKASWNSKQFTSAISWAETSLLWTGSLLEGETSSLWAEWLRSGTTTLISSFFLKLRGDKKVCSTESWSGSVIKRENGRAVHKTIPDWGWTTTPLQLTSVFDEKASFTVTTQQHLFTSFNSMLTTKWTLPLWWYSASPRHWTVFEIYHNQCIYTTR